MYLGQISSLAELILYCSTEAIRIMSTPVEAGYINAASESIDLDWHRHTNVQAYTHAIDYPQPPPPPPLPPPQHKDLN